MQLTIIIKKTNELNANCSKAVRSFRHKDISLCDIIFIDKFSDIVYGMIKSDWYFVLYDDEIIDELLLEALTIAGDDPSFDVFSCYKLDSEQKVTVCPRMFRKYVQIEKEFLYPIMSVKMETLLNGWVREIE